jgi:hypothetical protein
MRGLQFDRPDVADRARAQAGSGLGGRLRVVAGDDFSDLPPVAVIEAEARSA